MSEHDKLLVLNQLDQAKDLVGEIRAKLYKETKLRLLGTEDMILRTEDTKEECDKLDRLCEDFNNISDLLAIYKAYTRLFL